MTPFWHPLSAVLLDDPPVFATPRLARMVLAGQGETEFVYAGDRMWPALRHGQRVRLAAPGTSAPAAGDVLLVALGGITDLLRVERVEPERIVLRGDADPSEAVVVPPEGVLAFARPCTRAPVPAGRSLARTALDVAEALRGGPDTSPDAAETVRFKYETQAPFYEASTAEDLDPSLLEWVRAIVAPGGAVLGVGSGTGRETFALASAGLLARGIDYAPAMVDAARREAARRGLPVGFEVSDLRSHAEADGSLDAVFFTYDVYSFVPGSRVRVEVLRRVRGWLRERGVVFLSARLVRSWHQRAILTLQRIRRIRSGADWGASHTRWIDPGGAMRRSFVQYFDARSLVGEAAAAGFRTDGRRGGHWLLRPRGGERS